MQVIRQSRGELSVSAGSYLIGAAALLILPLKLLCAAFLAAAVHEGCHLMALKLCHAGVQRIRIGLGGARIEASPLPPLQELLCALAGPVGSFLCLLPCRWFPLLALCGLTQGLFNLLPVYPLDGGRILYCICNLTVPQHADKIRRFSAGWTGLTVLGICLFLFFRTFRVLFLILGGYFLYHTGLWRKTPCKEGRY